jgi:hypothetical protein
MPDYIVIIDKIIGRAKVNRKEERRKQANGWIDDPFGG